MSEIINGADDKGKSKAGNFVRRILRRQVEETCLIERKIRKPGDPIPPLRRRNRRGVKITKRENAPRGWNPNDMDIHEDDIEGMIKRCKERIEDGVMSQWWEKKLENYLKMQEERKKIMDSEPGLSEEVVMRLKRLEIVKSGLVRDSDKYDSIPNIDAIMNRYRSGGYTWEYGKVTYWSKGKFLEGPKTLDWDDYLRLHSEHNGPIGFWVEMHDDPGPSPQLAAIKHWITWGNNPSHPRGPSYTLELKTPGAPNTVNPNPGVCLDFLDDSGAENMMLWESDLDMIIANSQGTVPLLWNGLIALAGGGLLNGIYVVMEVGYVDPNSLDRITEFSRWPVFVIQGNRPAGAARLGGPYLRRMFYTGTAPMQPPKKMAIASSSSALASMLPSRKEADPTPDNFKWPGPGVGGFQARPLWAMNPGAYYLPTPALLTPLAAPLPGGKGPLPEQGDEER